MYWFCHPILPGLTQALLLYLHVVSAQPASPTSPPASNFQRSESARYPPKSPQRKCVYVAPRESAIVCICISQGFGLNYRLDVTLQQSLISGFFHDMLYVYHHIFIYTCKNGFVPGVVTKFVMLSSLICLLFCHINRVSFNGIK